MATPFASIVMPAFNRASFLRETIQSLLDQTFDDFELIVVEDHSFDDSLEVIRSFSDPRIIVVRNAHHLGQYPSRNRGHRMARGKYLFVMDSDDTAESNRLEEQIRFMEANPEVGLVGSNCRLMPQGIETNLPLCGEQMKVDLITKNRVFYHPALCLRKEWIEKYNLYYNEHYIFAGDGDLVMRSSRHFPIANVKPILMNYVRHENSITSRHAFTQRFIAIEIIREFFSVIDIDPTPEEIGIQFRWIWNMKIDQSQGHEAARWAEKILRSNRKKKFFDPDLLSEALHHKMSLAF